MTTCMRVSPWSNLGVGGALRLAGAILLFLACATVAVVTLYDAYKVPPHDLFGGQPPVDVR